MSTAIEAGEIGPLVALARSVPDTDAARNTGLNAGPGTDTYGPQGGCGRGCLVLWVLGLRLALGTAGTPVATRAGLRPPVAGRTVTCALRLGRFFLKFFTSRSERGRGGAKIWLEGQILAYTADPG